MDPLAIYRELADHYDRLNQTAMRDRFLILAADTALQSGEPAEAEQFRQRLLQTSRYHMLRPYGSFAEATQAPDVQTYLRDLRANYPLEVARQLLDSLHGNERPPLDQTQPVPSSWGDTPAGAGENLAVLGGGRAPEPPGSRIPAPPRQPALPPTAPLLDVYGQRAPAPPRPAWQASAPATLPPTEIPADGGPIPFRPHSQPVPRHVPPTRAVPAPPQAGGPSGRGPSAPAPHAGAWKNDPAPAPTYSVEPPPPARSWVGGVLGAVMFLLALALAGFTLARPFLPANLLR